MANTSIFNAFERMWQHIVAALENKSDISHNHTKEDITDLEIFSNEEQITFLIEEDMLPAVHDLGGKILTDENGNVILRY